MEKEKIFRESLAEKRPPLYVYRAKWESKEVFLNEIIPYITTDRKTILDFIETTKNLAKIECKDIARIIVVKKKGIRILVLEELREGENLRNFVKRKGSFSSIDSILLISSITKAMQKFHSRGIYGLGIEPENIIVSDAKNITIIHPLFPIAERFFRKTEKPEILNLRYLSPEQIMENTANEKSDLFNIGIILFEILNHIYPFSNDSYELLDFNERIPYCLRCITERLLSIDASQRFSSLNDFFEELILCENEIKSGERKKVEKITVKEEKPEEKIKEKTEEKRERKKEKFVRVKHVQIKKPLKKKIIIKKKKERVLSKRNTTIGATFVILLLLLIIYLPRFIRMMHPFEIATLSVDKNVVETNNNKGSVQWRFKAGSDISFSKAIDIDRDDRNEVVLGTGFLLTDKRGKTKNGKDNARLYILNENGRLLFTTEIGMASIYPGGSSQWMIYDVHFLDIDGDALIDLIALAVTEDSMDCILFTKTQKGGISKFWHAGKIEHTIVFNLSNEEKELICGGVNMRIGEKPVVFALHTNEYNDQSPPWGGNMRNRIDGLLWYRFLPGSGAIRRIEDKDSVSILVETENGIEKHYGREGIEILKDEATEEMLKERREKYIECFREFEKAKRFEKENDIESALLSLNNAINMKVKDKALKASLYYEKGMLLYRKEKWKPSSVALNNAVKSDPLFYEAFNKLGEVYLEREEFNNATSSFKKAHILSGKKTYFYRMVDCYTALGNYKTANNLLLRYDKNAKDKVLFLFASAKVAREKGDFRTTSLLYEKLIVLEPKNLIAYILLADTYADMNKNIEKADSLFTFSCTRDSSLFYKNIETSAWISYRKSRFEEAFQKINRAVEREESKKESSVASRRKLPRIYYRKAIIAQTLGEKEAKEEVIKRARSSPFCKGYVKKQINYLLASPK